MELHVQRVHTFLIPLHRTPYNPNVYWIFAGNRSDTHTLRVPQLDGHVSDFNRTDAPSGATGYPGLAVYHLCSLPISSERLSQTEKSK